MRLTPEQAREVCERIRQSPRQVRVLCPGGHFIADITLYVRDSDQAAADTFAWAPDDEPPLPPIRMRLQDNRTQHIDGAALEQPPGLRPPGWAGTVTLDCTNRRCTYSGSFRPASLAAELAVAALAGHAEHRLTN